MTIHRIGKNPKTAPSMPAMEAWPTGIEYATIATSRETTSDTTAAFQAAIRSTPSRTNSVSNGNMATSAVRASDPPTESRTGRYIGHLLWKECGGTCCLSGIWSDHIVDGIVVEEVAIVHVSRQRPDDGASAQCGLQPDLELTTRGRGHHVQTMTEHTIE